MEKKVEFWTRWFNNGSRLWNDPFSAKFYWAFWIIFMIFLVIMKFLI